MKKKKICVKFHKHEKLSSKLCWLHLFFYLILRARFSPYSFHSILFHCIICTQSLRFFFYSFALYCLYIFFFLSSLSLSVIFCFCSSVYFHHLSLSLSQTGGWNKNKKNRRLSRSICWPFWHTHCLLLFCSFSISATTHSLMHIHSGQLPFEMKKKKTIFCLTSLKNILFGINNVCNCMRYSRFFFLWDCDRKRADSR